AAAPRKTAVPPRASATARRHPKPGGLRSKCRTSSLPDRGIAISEALDPRPQLYLPRPGRTRLIEHIDIGGGDRVGIEHAVRLVRRLDPTGITDCPVDDEMSNVDALRGQFPSHALGQAAQGKFSHREGRRLGIALDARL